MAPNNFSWGFLSRRAVPVLPEINRRTILQQMRKQWFAYALLIPFFALLALFSFYPAGLAMYKSLFRWNPPTVDVFVALQNYIRIFSDDVFWISWRNWMLVAVWSFSIPFVMPFLAAEAIFNLRSQKAQKIYRVAILVPILIPGMVNLQLWRWLFGSDGGINLLLRSVGLGNLSHVWLNDPQTALPALLFMGFPWLVGGTAPLIYLAGLMNISKDMLDSAAIEGCSIWQRMVYIDLPQIAGQVRLFLVFGIIGLFQTFGTQLIMTNGGPGTSTMVPGLYLFKLGFGTARFEIINQNKGAACAVGVVLFILIMIFTYLGRRLVKSNIED